MDLPIANAKNLAKADKSRYFRVGNVHHLRVLDDISFEIKDGDRVGIVGRNGSGKSTLLRVMAGIYRSSRGRIEVTGDPNCLFTINMGMQPELTGRENIFLRSKVAGRTTKETKAKLDEIIAFAELEDFIDLPLRTYSSGMTTRLAFSISTAFSPDILLLDEWLGAGDANFQKKAAKRMHSLVDDATVTVLASHNRGLLKQVCNKLMWLHLGKLKGYGPLDEVYAAHDEYYAKVESYHKLL
ncbi:MAG: ABC transporter ATP-binding protein [Pseudomonadota bacterium]